MVSDCQFRHRVCGLTVTPACRPEEALAYGLADALPGAASPAALAAPDAPPAVAAAARHAAEDADPPAEADIPAPETVTDVCLHLFRPLPRLRSERAAAREVMSTDLTAQYI